jgi:hypothetical protein
LATTVKGNVAYQRRDIEREHFTGTGELVAEWQTRREIADPAEYDEAIKLRGKARSLVTAVCAASAFGLLCPEDKAGALSEAIEEGQRLAREFNGRAKLTRIGVYVIAGRIAPDDVEAVKAINSEIRELMTDMESGIRNLDVEAVRAAASKAKGIGQMLTPEMQARVATAVEAARKAARRIVKAGNQAAAEIDNATLRRLAEARTAFLDLEEGAEMGAPEASGRAIDFDELASDEPPRVVPVSRYVEGRGQLDWDRSPAAMSAAPSRPQFDLDL